MSIADISLISFYLAFGGYLVSVFSCFLKKERVAEVSFVVGFVSHTVSQIARAWYLGFFFANPMVNEISFLPWCLATLGLGLRLWEKEVWSRTLVPIFFFSLITLLSPKGILPPFPKNQTFLSPLFFGSEVFAHACFILGSWFAIFYMRKKGEYRIFHDLVIWGFVFYSVSQITGALWAYLGWGSPFHWSDRHLGSAALWCYYAAYLHLSFVARWDLKRRVWVAIPGLFFIVGFSWDYQIMEMRQIIGG